MCQSCSALQVEVSGLWEGYIVYVVTTIVSLDAWNLLRRELTISRALLTAKRSKSSDGFSMGRDQPLGKPKSMKNEGG